MFLQKNVISAYIIIDTIYEKKYIDSIEIFINFLFFDDINCVEEMHWYIFFTITFLVQGNKICPQANDNSQPFG